MNSFRKVVCLFTAVLLSTSFASADDGPDHRARQRLPIKLGTSGGPANDFDPAFLPGFRCVNGTLGAAVTCNGVLHVLSNLHVFCRANPGEEILQPGLLDTQCQPTGMVVAHYPGDPFPIGSNNVDAAIATAVPGAVDPSGEILDIGVPCSNLVAPRIGMAVAKSGRATGLTTGTVQAVNLTLQIGFPKDFCPNIDPRAARRGFVIFGSSPESDHCGSAWPAEGYGSAPSETPFGS